MIGFSQNYTIKPIVDERTELLSIIFRLAEAREYVNNNIQIYTNEIDTYFQPFKNHKVVKYAKKLRKLNGVSYDAVMSMAIHIEIKDGIIKFKDNIADNSLDKRWGTKGNKFVKYLNDFYQASDFHSFFINNKTFYDKTKDNFAAYVNKIDFNWFEKYYGEPMKGNFNLILSISNYGNYGPDVTFKNGNKNIYAIMSPWKADSLGFPIFHKSIVEIIIHEFSHSFCNHLIDENYDQMRERAEEFNELVKGKMKRQAYGKPKTMLYEILVRASVIKYFQAHTDDNINNEYIASLISGEKSRGFIWISQLVDLLSEYENGNYKSLKEFMPKIIELQNSLSPEKLFNKYKEECPYIVSSNIKNGDKNVDPNIKNLIVNFDRPMNIHRNGSTYGKQGLKCSLKSVEAKWNTETQQQWILSVELKPNKDYSIAFPAEWFSDAKSGNNLKETYYLDFKTRKE